MIMRHLWMSQSLDWQMQTKLQFGDSHSSRWGVWTCSRGSVGRDPEAEAVHAVHPLHQTVLARDSDTLGATWESDVASSLCRAKPITQGWKLSINIRTHTFGGGQITQMPLTICIPWCEINWRFLVEGGSTAKKQFPYGDNKEQLYSNFSHQEGMPDPKSEDHQGVVRTTFLLGLVATATEGVLLGLFYHHPLQTGTVQKKCAYSKHLCQASVPCGRTVLARRLFYLPGPLNKAADLLWWGGPFPWWTQGRDDLITFRHLARLFSFPLLPLLLAFTKKVSLLSTQVLLVATYRPQRLWRWIAVKSWRLNSVLLQSDRTSHPTHRAGFGRQISRTWNFMYGHWEGTIVLRRWTSPSMPTIRDRGLGTGAVPGVRMSRWVTTPSSIIPPASLLPGSNRVIHQGLFCHSTVL